MDFRDSPSEAAFRAEATAFLDVHAPREFRSYTTEGADMEEVFREHVAWQKTLAQHGWGALTWPKPYGGRGLGPIEQIVWNEELTKRGTAHSMLAVGIGMAGPTLIAHGTDAQKQRYLDAAAPRRRSLVPALQRARRGLGPRLARHARGARRRRLDRERAEDLVLRRAARAVRHPDRAHRREGPRSTRASRTSCST